VLLQDYPRFEHIIIDNCSTDGTLEILRRYSHLIWISEPDQGQSDALNKGFRMATGDIVGWLNSDDRYLPNCFWAIKDFFARYKNVDIVYGDYRWIDEKGNLLQLRKEPEFSLFMLKYLHVLTIPTTSTFFRRRIFEEGNFLNLSYRYAMDYEFFLRLALKGYKISHIKGFLADFRWHSKSKSVSATSDQFEERERALREHDPFLQALPLPIRTIIRKLLMIMARTKRCLLKGIKGYYFQQWPRKASR
jgi:glycosyltransferase involved in cell wall biosynthesis